MASAFRHHDNAEESKLNYPGRRTSKLSDSMRIAYRLCRNLSPPTLEQVHTNESSGYEVLGFEVAEEA